MTSRRQQITLQPEVLRWARDRAGLSQEELAKKIPVSLARVTEWEETGKISIAQADKLAERTYTPLGYLYLSESPDESLPIRDFRTRGGFALVDEYAPLVFVNSADYPVAQMVTLAHEVAHLLIGETGLSVFERLLPTDHETERFCDQVAAEFLISQQALQAYWLVVQDSGNPFRDTARKFKMSTVVAARRLLDLGLIDQDTFLASYNKLRHGGSFWNVQRWRIGPRFAGAVARAAKEGRLSYREAYSLTDLRGNTFERMPEEMGIIL